MNESKRNTTTLLKGYPRFSIEGRIGAGGMGNVYAARDHERDETVALKTLHRQDATALYNFKKEFRTLADVAHPNLVNLYELIADDENCFFTMELVDGVNFLEYTRPEDTPEDGHLGLDMERLRTALGQLAQGVKALHEAGKLHRDLKPSNVMVNTEGRVVILDFGVATETSSNLMPQTIDSGLAGTLAYMSPEQARGENSTSASDWYAVGVILFEALTGELPFTGGLSKLLTAKMHDEARSPAEVTPNLPEDLVTLCRQLLAREAASRPKGREILEALGDSEATLPTDGYTPHERQETALVGRADEARTLTDAFATTREGRAVTVYVHGQSGMGKTVLIHSFLEKLVAADRTVVLAGRCYERELVPYKALDGLIDSLSKHLLAISSQQVEVLLPRDVRALTLLFPVLLRVDAIAWAARSGRESPDRLTLRRRAFTALRDLLTRMAHRHPLVLYIDDLHWADADSTTLLNDLLRPPAPPPLLLLASFRSEEIVAKPFLRRLLERTGTGNCLKITVDPLDDKASTELASALLGGKTTLGLLVQTIVRESKGNPFVIEQMAGYALASDSTLSTIVSLEEMLINRIRKLPQGAGPLLDTLAVAGRPLNAAIAHRAAGLGGDERPLVAALKNANLLRSSGSAERIEVYHDRIRETLAERIEEPTVRSIHLRLAETLVARGHDDPEALFEHFHQAGDQRQAAIYAVRAAHKASDALAFDRATVFFRRALDLGEPGTDERFELTHSLAEALANAGRPAQAAAAFLDAAALNSGQTALDCRSRAAQEYLSGGYYQKGTLLIRSVLEAIGMRVPTNKGHALLSWFWQRLRLRLRGMDYELRSAEDVPSELLHKVDTCWAVASSLITAQPIQGLDFQTRHLRFALDAGEPSRLARALAIETSIQAQKGSAGRRQTLAFRATTRELVRQLENPYVQGITTLHEGISDYLVGQWKSGADLCDKADAIFTDHCKGVLWDQTTARRYALACLLYMGEMAEVERRVAQQMVDAEERGNQLGTIDLRTRVNMTWLAIDDPQRAHREAALALEGTEGFHLQHYNGFWACNQADLYAGDVEPACLRLEDVWPKLKHSLLLRIELLEVEAHCIRARTALAAASDQDSANLLPLVRESASIIAAKNLPYTTVLADLLHAGLASLEGNQQGAINLLRQLLEKSEGAQMHLHTAAARRRLGGLLGGDEGQKLISKADGWMHNQSIVQPHRMTRMLVPGIHLG